MKKKSTLFPSIAIVICIFAMVSFTSVKAANPYLPLWEHLPDGEPRVFEDPDNPGKFRAYIIGSHDVRFGSYCGPDIRIWSAPVEDLSDWRDEGPVFTYPIDGQWDVMYAPDLVEIKRKDGKKEYYLYPHSRGRDREAMVTKGSRPNGPFTPINTTTDGRGTVPGSIMGFDPSVFIEYITNPKDPDYKIGFRAYGFWGFQRSFAAQLDQKTMYSLRPGTEIINYLIPSSSGYGAVRDPEGTVYPNLFPNEDVKSFNFFEASSIRKVGNKYVLVFSGFSGPDYGLPSTNSALRYAYGDTPLGPWKSGGVLVDSRAPVLNKDGSSLETTNSGHNTHGSIQQINDQWYVFYHRPPRGFGFARQSMVAPVSISWDEKPVAKGGKVTIRAFDPYSENQIWTAKDKQGNEYTGAEVTSEGFHIYGLDPYQYYSAGYACYLSNPETQQDSWDIWDNNMPITNVAAGNIIGYKYFGFGGLAKNTKGVKAFEGTKQGNHTRFNLFLTPKTPFGFKISVWLDGPWENDTWKGTKIGEISVPSNSARETTQFSIDVSKFIDHLDKKHAIFLVAEQGSGPGGRFRQGGLFDLIGLGFSSDTKKIVRPVAPQVNISVNDVVIDLPATPVRSTNNNGITGYDLYEANVSLAANTTKKPVVAATASDPAVKISVTQAESTSGTAVVKFDYKGIVKTYKVAFSGLAQGQTFKITGNPIITGKFTADPAPMVYNGTLYLYVGHDEYYDGQDNASGGKEFNITEWLCYSTKDMINWTDHGSVLKPTDFKWGVGEAWASQVIEKNGKFFYYTTVQAGAPYNSKVVGVAVGDSPVGPFKDAIGKPLITDDMTPNGPRGWWNDIDPTIFIDDDGTPWMSWGNGTCFLVKLKPNMIELDGPIYEVPVPNYVEGPWLHKRNGIYYLTYASHLQTGAEMIAYAMADKIEGPWTYRGVLAGHAENSFTIHPGIIEFNNQWYLFYHNAALTIDGKKGAIGRRSVCLDYLYYNPDETMVYVEQTKAGITVPPKTAVEVSQIKNPFPPDAPDKKIELVKIK